MANCVAREKRLGKDDDRTDSACLRTCLRACLDGSTCLCENVRVRTTRRANVGRTRKQTQVSFVYAGHQFIVS